jgi:F-type H+-transporting ATPase subunit delta
MGNIKLSGRYAKSLFDLAVERNQLATVYQDAMLFNEVAAMPEFANMMRSPIIKADKKTKIFEAIFAGKLSELTVSFLKITINKGREIYLKEIMHEVVNMYNKAKGIITVKFTSAVAVDTTTIEKVKTLIQQNTSMKNIDMKSAVNENLLGGFVLEYENNIFDASIAHDLKAVKKQFLDNVYVKKF